MHNKLPMHLSARCGAMARAKTPCQSPAMTNGRCRMRGGKSPEAPIGNSNARKHGLYSAEAIEERKMVAEHICTKRELFKDIGP